MFTARDYIKAGTLEEAYTLNQKRSNRIIGGMMWLKMSRKSYGTLIDLSGLSLNQITEDEDTFHIGAMCTLRQLETHPGLDACFGGYFSQALSPIVGVQFRNTATVGGSVYGRYGFSDVLTALLALDCEVETYPGGRMPLAAYLRKPYDRDILTQLILHKDGRRAAYLSQRRTATDFPVLTCALSQSTDEKWHIVLGARPLRAMEIDNHLSPCPTREEITRFAGELSPDLFGSNQRGSREYRHILAEVLLRRGIGQIVKEIKEEEGLSHAD